MKICPRCGASMDDGTAFCTNCGTSFTGQPQLQNQTVQQYYAQPYAPAIMPWDHTAEFDPKDISDNKVICMLLYLSGFIGILIALLSQKQSPYVAFHLRQALKFMAVEALLGVIAAVLAVTFIVPIAAVICLMVLFVVKIICFFQICGNQAKEPPIIRSLGFLK